MLNKGGVDQGESADQRITSIKLDRAKDVRYELVVHAQDERADLLVTGAARMGTLMAAATAMAGRRSVSWHVLNNAPCPVLVVATPTLLAWSMRGPPADSVVRQAPQISPTVSQEGWSAGREGSSSLGGAEKQQPAGLGTPAAAAEKRAAASY